MCHLQMVELLLVGVMAETTAAGTGIGSRALGGTRVYLLRLNLLRRPTTTTPSNGPADGGPRPNDDDHLDRARATRVRKADKTELLKYPQCTAWRTWRARAIHAIASAAGRHGGVAHEWILKVETQDLANLQEPGVGWVSPDQK